MKNRITSTPLMIIVIILALLILSTMFVHAKPPGKMKRDRQKGNIHWQVAKRTASGQHTYFVGGFGKRGTCDTFKACAIKKTNYNRYAYWKPSKR